ncbi:MAG: hypothetical protein EBY28_17245 [Betaproteobacteria bacterium]|nr:hypothetical protein [Betaproteobacteria bacterium]
MCGHAAGQRGDMHRCVQRSGLTALLRSCVVGVSIKLDRCGFDGGGLANGLGVKELAELGFRCVSHIKYRNRMGFSSEQVNACGKPLSSTLAGCKLGLN